jgi:dihydrofolate reductase
MIAALIAVDEAGGMGYNGSMPWPHNKDDMQWFKKTTQNHIVVMGRNTWNSPDMPSPLPGRHNVLFTNNFIERDDIDQIRGDACEALKTVQKNNKKQNVFVIGGQNLLLQARPVLEKVFVTRIPGEYLSDITINISEFLDGFSLVNKLNLGTCIVEEYQNDTIQTRTRTRTRKRSEEN